MVDGRLGKGAQVPGRRGVVAAQGFATVQPGQGSVQQGRTAHLTPCAEQGQGQERESGERRAPGILPATRLVQEHAQPRQALLRPTLST